MLALIVDPDAPGRRRLGEVPDPVLGPRQILMEVRHSSLNAAELFFAERSEPGTVLALTHLA
jgi:NADPH:quinone reductase